MEIFQYVEIFKRRKWIIIITMLATFVVTVVASIYFPRKYSASSVLRIIPYNTTNPSYTQMMYADRIMKTYVEIATSKAALTELRTRLGIPESRPIDVKAEIIPETELIQVTVKDLDPMMAYTMSNQLAEIMVGENIVRDIRLTVVDSASMPKSSSQNSALLMAVFGLFVGAIGGIGLALISENIDKRLYTTRQVEAIVKSPILGEIPAISRRKQNDFLIDHPPVNDAFRRLTINLLSKMSAANIHTLMLTSAIPGEGKTSIACNLARYIAQFDMKALVVDADFYRPAVSKYFYLPPDDGLDAVLMNNVSLDEAVKESQFPGVFLLMNEGRMRGEFDPIDFAGLSVLLERLKNQYDIIIVDSPAYLGVADTSALATLVDGVLLVSRVGRVNRDDLTFTIDHLGTMKARILGVVVNGVKNSSPSRYNRYYDYQSPKKQAQSRVDQGRESIKREDQVIVPAGPPKPAREGVTPTVQAIGAAKALKIDDPLKISDPIKSASGVGQKTRTQGVRKKPPRILILLENHAYPFDVRVQPHAEALHARGYHVTVASPRIKGLAWHETIDDVEVYRFPFLQAGKSKFSYLLEFSVATVMMTLITLWIWMRRGMDVLYFYNPPDLLFLVGAIPKLFKVKVIFDVRDVAPELFQAKYSRVNPTLSKLLCWMERKSCRLADHVIVVNESYRHLIMNRNHISGERISIVRQGPDLERINPLEPVADLREQAPILIGYLGSMAKERGVGHLLRALKYLDQMNIKDWLCVLIGQADPSLDIEREAENLGIVDRIWCTGFLTQEKWLPILSTVDICVDPGPSNPINNISTTNKMMDYMALGKPLVVFDLPERHVTAGDSALYAQPNDEEQFALKLAKLIEAPDMRREMGDIGRKLIEQKLAWQYQRERLLNIFGEITQWQPEVTSEEVVWA